MGRRRKGVALILALALAAPLAPQPAVAAGGFTIVMGGANPLHVLGDYNLGTYVTADLDGDGDLDVVVRERLGDTTIDVLRNDGGSFTLLTGPASPFAGISFPAHSLNFLNSRVLVGDFDADGDVDLWHHAVTFAAFYRNDGATFSAHVGAGDPLSALATRDPGSYVVIDVDDDTDPDVVAREPGGDASLELFRNDAGTFVSTAAPFASVSFASSPANFLSTNVLVLDADRDGDQDLWHHGVGLAALYRNDGGTFSAQTGAGDPLAELGAYAQHSYAAADIDSDGDADVVARERVGQMSLDVLRNDPGGFVALTGGASPFAGVALPTSDFESMYVLVGDFDDDGDADVYNQALNELYVQAGSAPRATARTPAHRSNGVPVTSTLSITFDEPVTLGVGTVVLRRAGTGAVIERLRTTTHAAQFGGVGTTTVSISPSSPLPFATVVTLTVSPGAFVSSTDGDAYAGLAPIAWRIDTAANTPPSVGSLDGDAVTFTEGDPPVALDAGTAAVVTDADGIGFGGGELTVTIDGAVAAEDRLGFGATAGLGALTDNGIAIHLALDGSADAAAITAFLRSLTYANDAGDDPTPGARSVEVTLTDGHGGSAGASVALSVVAVNDPPVVTAPMGYAATTGSIVTIDEVAVTDVDDDAVHLSASVDVGSFADGQTALTLSGSLADLRAVIDAGAFTWRAPLVSSSGTFELTVDDGDTTVGATVALDVMRVTPPAGPPGTSTPAPVDPAPTALLSPAPWEQPITYAATRSHRQATQGSEPRNPLPARAAADGERGAADAGTASRIGAPARSAAGGSEGRGHTSPWILAIGLLLTVGLLLVVVGGRDRDDRTTDGRS